MSGRVVCVLSGAALIGAARFVASCQYVSGLEPFSARPDAGPAAQYAFDEGTGTIARDRVGGLDLSFADASVQPTWIDGGINLALGAYLTSSSPASSIVERCNSENAFTVIAVVRPARADLGGPARIVSLSPGFVLGVEMATFVARVGTVALAGGVVTAGAFAHLALTRDVGGATHLLVDGNDLAIDGDGGAVAWEPALLSVGAEADAATPWEGEVHRVSVHCRFFTQAEVQADQALGP